jgi:hypothetical protein
VTALLGTAGGLHEMGPEGGRVHLDGRDVTAVDGLGWVLVDGQEVLHCEHDHWESYGRLTDDLRATCLLVGDDALLLGLAGGHLVRMDDEGFEMVTSFESAPGRAAWYTPWGGPADTRSLAAAEDGTLYANVHVGGILRSRDGGATWEPTIDLHVDVHQVVAVPGTTTVVAATGTGFAATDDGGDTWVVDDDGLDGSYLRAVAVAGDTVVVSASHGPGGQEAALYRRPLGGGRFERLARGLPERFAANVDTGWLAASGEAVVVAGPDGTVRRSDDGGANFDVVAHDLPAPRWAALSAT